MDPCTGRQFLAFGLRVRTFKCTINFVVIKGHPKLHVPLLLRKPWSVLASLFSGVSDYHGIVVNAVIQ